MHQRWDDVVFAHWPVPPEAVAARLPTGLRPDLFAGTAWVSLVPFWMRDLRLQAFPPIPTTREFAEVNVRTYVQGPDGPGVWFCSLDATHALPVATARAAYGLPYFRARVDCHVTDERDGPIIDWSVRRRGSNASGRLAVLARSEPIDDPLAVFLTARWRLYTVRRRVRTAVVEHDPWPLLAGEPLDWDPGLVEAAGLHVDGAPLVHWSPGVDVTVGRPRRAGRHRG